MRLIVSDGMFMIYLIIRIKNTNQNPSPIVNNELFDYMKYLIIMIIKNLQLS